MSFTKTSRRRLDRQLKTARIRSKYGPTMRPALVTIKRLDGSEIKTVDQSILQHPRTYSDILEKLARAAGYDSYAAYLRSDHWQSLRKRVLRRDRYRCVLCGSKKRLQVHHDKYVNLGREPLKDLKTLCTQCHEHIHG